MCGVSSEKPTEFLFKMTGISGIFLCDYCYILILKVNIKKYLTNVREKYDRLYQNLKSFNKNSAFGTRPLLSFIISFHNDKFLKTVGFLTISLFLNLCTSSETAFDNSSPQVDAGKDASAITGFNYWFSGVSAKDLNGKGTGVEVGAIAKVEWHITGVPTDSSIKTDEDEDNVNNKNSLTDAYFTPDVDGAYMVQLKVWDNGVANDKLPGLSKTAIDTVVITADSGIDFAKTNPAPTAEASEDQTSAVNAQYTHSGASATDNNFLFYEDYVKGTGFTRVFTYGSVSSIDFTYAWTVDSEPSGSSIAINNAATLTPDFTPVLAGDYVLKLTVTDNGKCNDNSSGCSAQQDTATVKITVE